jgi:AcrR family transcriptional regulator
LSAPHVDDADIGTQHAYYAAVLATSKRTAYHHGSLPEALLAAAEALVTEHGAAGFSLREAARYVGVDPAASYRHFRDRDDLLRALARRGFTALATRMEEAIAGKRRPKADLRILGQCYLDFAVEKPALFAVMFGGSNTPSLDERVRGSAPAGRTPIDILRAVVSRWARSDDLRQPEEVVTLTLWAAVHGVATLVVQGALPIERDQRDALLKAELGALLIGLAQRPRYLGA